MSQRADAFASTDSLSPIRSRESISHSSSLEPIGLAPEPHANPSQSLNQSLDQASHAERPWGRRSLAERLAWAANFRRAIARHQDELSACMLADVGKPRYEAILAEILPLITAIKWLERKAPGILGTRWLSGAPWWMRSCRARVMREPLGRVAIIATWNYPVQLLGIQLAQALVAGNEVIVKPSERSSTTQALLLDLAEGAGLPKGVLERAPATRDAGKALLTSAHFDHLVFTGSTAVGLEVARALATTLTPATLELSGRDSAFVLKDADPKHAARSLWGAMTMNAGQTCMGPRRALVHEDVYVAFCTELERLAKKAQPRALIDEAAAKLCYDLCDKALAMGARDAGGGLVAPQGSSWRPSAMLDCPAIADLVEGRHFGPAIAVVRVDSLARALEIHHACDQHLATSIFTREPKKVRSLAVLLGSGVVTINDCIVPTSHPAVSIAGVGQSGVGISRGEQGLLAMTRPLFITRGPGVAKRSIKPPPKFVLAALTRFVRFWYGRGGRK